MKKLTIFATLLAITSVVATTVFAADSNEKTKTRKSSSVRTVEKNVDRNNSDNDSYKSGTDKGNVNDSKSDIGNRQ